jgi:hypothetical protein
VTLDPSQPVPVAGDSFDLFDAGSSTINFEDLALPTLSSGLEWDTSAIDSGVLSVIDTAEGYMAWAEAYAFPPGMDGPTTDANQNGMANVFDWLFGSEPAESAAASPAWPKVGFQTVSGSEFPGADSSKRYLTLTATVRKSIPGWTLVAQAADSPTSLNDPGSSDDIVSILLNDLGDFEERAWIHTIPVGEATSCFMRIKLSSE